MKHEWVYRVYRYVVVFIFFDNVSNHILNIFVLFLVW